MDANQGLPGAVNEGGFEPLRNDLEGGLFGAFLGLGGVPLAQFLQIQPNFFNNPEPNFAQFQAHVRNLILQQNQPQNGQLLNLARQNLNEVPDDELPNIEHDPEDAFSDMLTASDDVRAEIERVFEGEVWAGRYFPELLKHFHMMRLINENVAGQGARGVVQHFGPEFANPAGHWLFHDQNPAPILHVELEPQQARNREQENVRNVHGLLTDALYYAKEAVILEPNAETRHICEMLEIRLHELGERMRNERLQ